MQLILLLFAVCLLYGQEANPKDFGIRSKKALKYYLLAKDEFSFRNYRGALQRSEEALAIEPAFAHAWYLKGLSLYKLKRYKEAIEALEKAKTYFNDKEPIVYFYLADCYYKIGDYEKSYQNDKRFIQLEDDDAQLLMKASERAYRSEFAMNAMKHPVEFQPINLGPEVNSEGEDYMPYLTADEQMLFFTSRRPGCTGGYNPYLRGFAEDFYYSVRDKNGKWQKARNLGPPINTEENEGAACISQDGSIVIFTACNRKDSYGGCDLYIAEFNGAEWSHPRNLGKVVNSRYWDTQPCLANDNKTLYFVSNRPGGVGGTDIWVTRFENGRWTPPENLGPPINTPGNEYAPFIHADGVTLYFASDYHLGFGSTDLFMSQKTDTGWTQPKNLGYPINTAAEERNIYVNAQGTRAYYNSNREDSYGKNDIYFFTLDPRIRPNPATFVRGIVLDSLTKAPVAAKIYIIDLTTKDTIREAHSLPKTGKFLVTLPLHRRYAAYVEAKGYLFRSIHFSLEDVSVDEYFDLKILLMPIRKGAVTALRNIFFDFDKADLKPESTLELQKVVRFMKENPRVKIEIAGHTDDVGSEAYNLRLSQRRAEVVRDYLIRHGIAPERIVAKGYGESQPLVPNTSEENRALNRRTELRILEVE